MSQDDQFIRSEPYDRHLLVCVETKKAIDLGWLVESFNGDRAVGLSRDPSYRVRYNENQPRTPAELVDLVLWKFLAEHAGKELVVYESDYLVWKHEVDEERWEIIGWDRNWDPTYEEYLSRFIDRPDGVKPIKHSRTTITLDGRELHLEHPIIDAFEIDGRVIVLYDPDPTAHWGSPFPNLIAIDHEENSLWVAELPTVTDNGNYYEVTYTTGLIARTWTGWECEIDIETGKIISRTSMRK